MVRFSYGLAPVYPAAEAVELIAAADELGFHGCYLGDDLNLQDPWTLCAAAATRTERIRLGLSATHVLVRQPILVAQALGTLDQLSNGRAEAAIGIGDVSMLDAYGIDWRDRPIARLREGFEIIRAFLEDGELTHDGEFFRYREVATLARPVQKRLPLLVAGMVGPQSFRLAGELGDGLHCAGCSRGYSAYVVEQVRRGAERAGRDWRELDLAAWCITAVAEDSTAAKDAARGLVAGWLGQLPAALLERHGLDPGDVTPVVNAMAAGEAGEALRLATDEMVEAFSVAGTPEECVEKIRTHLVEPGIHHVVMGIADPDLVEGITGQRPSGVPGVREQLQLIRERIFPAFADRA